MCNEPYHAGMIGWHFNSVAWSQSVHTQLHRVCWGGGGISDHYHWVIVVMQQVHRIDILSNLSFFFSSLCVW